MKPINKAIVVSACCIAAAFCFSFVKKSMSSTDESGYIGRSDIRIEDGVLSPEALLSLGRISDPQLSPDGKTVLYGVSYTSIDQNKAVRNLFVCRSDVKLNCKSPCLNPDASSQPVQLTKFASSVNCARWSRDGEHIYYIKDGQIFRARFKGNRLGIKQKISDVPAGISEFKLSPDESKIFYISTISGPVKSPRDSDPSLDKARAYVAEDLMYRHWDHWVCETPRTFVAPLGKAVITPEISTDILGDAPEGIELPTEPFGGAEQLDWSPDSRYIVYSCRKLKGKEYAFSTNTSLYIYDTETKETVQLTFGGGYDTDPVWSPDGQSIAWVSMARDGYEADRQRLMVRDVNMGRGSFSSVRELTASFAYDVVSPVWTSDSKSLLFCATTDGIGSIYRADVNSATVERLTPADWLCSFSTPYAMLKNTDSDGFILLSTVNSMDFPTELARINIAGSDASYQLMSNENGHIIAQLDTVRTEHKVFDTPNGEKLHCWVLYPYSFDPSKTYPGIEVFNGGPQSSMDESWSYRWNFRMMCQQGYVVVLPCRHGDSGFGQPWKEQISGDYQGLNMQDYMIAGKWFKSQPWAGKLAGTGASYGGFSVYNLMGIHGNLYDCFIAHAGIFDERSLWFTTEEMWFANWDNGGLKEYAYTPGKTGSAGDGITFGGMQQAGAPYADVARTKRHYAGDPVSRATKWHTPILCMHGMMDYRIPYEQGMAAFNAAQMMGVPSKLVVFPEENHWILRPQNALFWHRCYFDWIKQWTSNVQ